MRGACNTHFFIYKKHKCKKHKARILLFSIVNLRNPVVNYRKLEDLEPIEMFLINNKSVYMRVHAIPELAEAISKYCGLLAY